MKTLFMVCLIAFPLLFGGCNSVKYRWVKDGPGLPYECVQTYQFADAEIQYCIVPRKNGGYYFEGVFRADKDHRDGYIQNGSINIGLLKDGEIVYRWRLYRDSNYLRKPIHLSARLRYDGDFDDVWFYGDYTVNFR